MVIGYNWIFKKNQAQFEGNLITHWPKTVDAVEKLAIFDKGGFPIHFYVICRDRYLYVYMHKMTTVQD